jgi:hypothetical protein
VLTGNAEKAAVDQGKETEKGEKARANFAIVGGILVFFT